MATRCCCGVELRLVESPPFLVVLRHLDLEPSERVRPATEGDSDAELVSRFEWLRPHQPWRPRDPATLHCVLKARPARLWSHFSRIFTHCPRALSHSMPKSQKWSLGDLMGADFGCGLSGLMGATDVGCGLVDVGDIG